MSSELKSVLEDGPIEGEPLVSVCVITYNHGKYIRQCLDGILMQKVNFPYEILIHDDASPDDTADIIREYWEKYPTVIKPILREENQYSKGVDVSRFNFDRAKAKYIAQCEGDDYWMDDGKLQMQVDFLENYKEYSATSHSYVVVDSEGMLVPNTEIISNISGVFSKDDIKYYRLPGATATLVYRNIFSEMDRVARNSYYACAGYGDQKTAALLTMYGNIQKLPNIMSAYRYVTTKGTSYSALTKGKNLYGGNYQYLVDINNFSQDNFGVKLDTEIAAFCIMLMAIKKWILSPSRENRDVLWKIHIKNIENPHYLKSMIKKIALHPSTSVYIMKTIYSESKVIRYVLANTGC